MEHVPWEAEPLERLEPEGLSTYFLPQQAPPKIQKQSC